jgi:multicomponent Na+:H+ antiporter subunit C
MSLIQSNFIYWFFVILLMIGLYGAVGKVNLVKKLIGLSIFQTAIILFYVSIGYKSNGAHIPILEVSHGETVGVVSPADYINPLPHVLMLTAIVVGVATVGVALSVIQRLYAEYGTLEEDEILDLIAKE